MIAASEFQQRVLNWFDQHGRKDLPWQQDINPYRVWVSEIMLQQTQVQTVIPFFQRFIAELPRIADLAAASEDEVLHLWTGLGYYARARNLQRAAKTVIADYDGEFPANLEQLMALPGIGRSTAGAIRSIAFQQSAAILDGNVKRVLARYAAIAGWPGQTEVVKKLWQLAAVNTPTERVAQYNQAMMDLGATVCVRSLPRCEQCPLSDACAANRQRRQAEFPGRKPRKILPVKSTLMLMVVNPAGEVHLAKRPDRGIWGGLWSFPEFETESQARNYCLDTFASPATTLENWKVYRHSFSHYHLDIQPTLARLDSSPQTIMEGQRQLWYNSARPEAIGLAAPVAKLLKELDKLR